MTIHVPRLRLSFGQLSWSIARGQPPSEELKARLRYLRQLGIPVADGEPGRGAGQGRRILYGFDDLIETGVAVEALRLRVKPKDLRILVDHRRACRHSYHRAHARIAPGAWDAPWIRERRAHQQLMLPDEVLLRLHDRFDQTPGRFSIAGLDDALPATDLPLGTAVEVLPGQSPLVLISLTKLVLELVTWAREAPATRPGPRY